MTVIAWDGRYVAADSLVCYGSTRGAGPVKKIRTTAKAAYALTGHGALFDPMIEWIENGAKPDDKPSCGDNYSDTLILQFLDGKCYGYRVSLPYPDELIAPDAWGAGADFAIGAMEAGKNAAEAVEIAIRRETYTGGPVEFIDLHELGKQEQAA
jgi:ATP-dependent protease HslVU (ClpYQ) peptidase subunit